MPLLPPDSPQSAPGQWGFGSRGIDNPGSVSAPQAADTKNQVLRDWWAIPTGVPSAVLAQRGHWASSGYAARNRPSGFARWPKRCLIHASRRYEKMGTYARCLRSGQITPSQIICFRVPGGATLGPVHKCPQFHNLGIEALWFETAVLALPPAKALPRTG